MAISRDKDENRRLTRKLMLTNEPIERTDPSWLGNGGKGGVLDYELLKGATFEELIDRSGRTANSVRAHFQHLKKVQGLEVVNENGVYSLSVPDSNKEDNNSDSLFSKVTREHIAKAVEDFNSKGTPNGLGSSKYYDVKINDVLYPPKPIMAYANYHAVGRPPGNYFSGGVNTRCFKAFERLGIEIVEKSKLSLDEELLNEHFEAYINYCKRSQWLTYREAYKFRFGKWLSENVDFDLMNDQEVLKTCIESQNQEYDFEEKGVNFIKSSNRYHDDFITLKDISVLRKLSKGDILEKNDLKDSPLSFPKFSCWAGSLITTKYKIYANEDLLAGLAYLYDLDKYPKAGLKAFNWANDSLLAIEEFINNNYKSEAVELLTKIFSDQNDFSGSNSSWLLQDFLLYLERRVLNKEIEYYWVNQGSSYKIELEHKCIAATTKNHHHHKRLKAMMEGDIIINYAKSGIRATSVVTKEWEEAPRPYSPDGQIDLIVGVDYTELDEPITIDSLQSIFKDHTDVLPKRHSPFNKKMEINQAYCLSFNKESYNLIFDIPNYWVFQGNPKIYDFHGAIRNDDIESWSVRAHKDKIHEGDKIIFWLTGDDAGVYALGEVTSEVFNDKDEENDFKHYVDQTENKESDRVNVAIDYNLIEEPILNDQLDSVEAFRNFNGGTQGTNFSATEEEYEAILDLISSSDLSFSEVKSKFDQNDLEVYFNFLREIIDHFGLEPGDERLVFGYYANRINFTVGQRYCWNLFSSERKGKFGVISKDKLLPESEPFTGKSKEHFYNYFNHINFSDKDKMLIFSAIKDELNRTNKSSFYKYNKSDFENFMFNELSSTYNKTGPMTKSINQILYGPPGTGKTYKLKNEYFKKYTTKETSITSEKNFENVVKDLSWWEVIALALLELKEANVSQILNNRWVKERTKFSESVNIRAGIWGQLQHHTVLESNSVNYSKRSAPYIFDKTKEKSWIILEDEVKEQTPELFEIQTRVDNFIPNPDKEIKRYVFTTFHQSFAYEDFIEGIKPVIANDQEESSDLAYEIQSGVFKELCLEAQKDPKNKYAIFIDEINRGNVSNIFGELITLIESDKRAGADNEMSAKLPYSKKQFSVPNNVDIYGTMNTADRSVEALDTALRRRFSFQEIMPNPNLLNEVIEGVSLREVLTTINDRIEVLIDRDHTIGHSYFMGVNTADDLQLVFKDKIIPLLQEYFYGDYGKIGLVLGNGFVELQKKKDNLFADFTYDRKDELNNDFFILKPLDNGFSILDAIRNLLYADNSEN